MAQKTINGSPALAQQIKRRRNELGLTIEEAASQAGVGTKTWCRYESGESIRTDKCKVICRALNWHYLPDQNGKEDEGPDIEYYQNHKAWSPSLAENFGIGAAVSFAAGSEILLDHIADDMNSLSSMPAGTHIGQLGVSWLCGGLPEQFLMHYDYEFLYQMKCTVKNMIVRASIGGEMRAHSVMEELIFYLCNEEASVILALGSNIKGLEDDESVASGDWVFDLFEDMDIITFLYADMYLDSNDIYHFDHWSEQQFFMDSDQAECDALKNTNMEEKYV